MQTEEFIERLGNRIKYIRLNANLTQLEVASKCNIEKSAISRIERGATNPSVKTLKLIADSMGVEVKDFFTF